MFNGTYATCMKCVKHKKIGFKVKEILEFGILWNFQPIRTCFDKIIRKIIKKCHSLVFTAVSSAMFLFLPLPVIIKCNQKAVLCSIKNNNYKKQLIHLSTFLTINFIKFSTIFFFWWPWPYRLLFSIAERAMPSVCCNNKVSEMFSNMLTSLIQIIARSTPILKFAISFHFRPFDLLLEPKVEPQVHSDETVVPFSF